MVISWNLQAYDRYVEPNSAPAKQFADAIRVLAKDRVSQARLLVWMERSVFYRFDYETWGRCIWIATPTEMEQLRVERGWPAIHGDCKAIAILTASVAKNLGIEYRFANAPLHMWIEVKPGARWYAVDAHGKQGPGVQPLALNDWVASRSPAEKASISNLFKQDAAYRAAYKTVFNPPFDPETFDSHRLPAVRYSFMNSRGIPAFVGALVIILYVYTMKRLTISRPQGSETRHRFGASPAAGSTL